MSQSSQKIQLILENLLFAWIGFSVVLLIGGQSLELPPILHVLGRSHPLLLHFPITLLLGGVFLMLIPSLRKNPTYRMMSENFLLWGSNFAGLTVIAGLILATEEYEGDALDWHQWAGIITFLGGVLLYFLQKKPTLRLEIPAGIVGIAIILTGHWGANITHGEDFLLAPILPEAPQKTLAESEVFQDLVNPILQTKCESCHREGKTKGELRLDHLDGVKKGGESGPFVVANNLEESLLIHHINLPLEDEDHMPPKNKAQLTDEELKILIEWVNEGAHFDKKVVDLPKESNLFLLASAQFDRKPTYDFDPASPATITELTNFFRLVEPVYPESPALEVTYFGIAAFDPNSLTDLKAIKNQLVSLRLDKMPLEDVDLGFLKSFPNLKSLSLNFCDLSTDQIESLASFDQLEDLALSGNKVTDTGIQSLQQLSTLKNLYLWETGLNENQMKDLEKTLADTHLHFGFQGDEESYQLNSPIIAQEKNMFSDSLKIELNHPIPSVQIRYTLDDSEPDSLNGFLYTEPFYVKTSGRLRVRAFAENWIPSEEVFSVFMKSGIRPKSYALLNPPNPNYQANLVETIFDQIKGKANHTSGEWLGYQNNPFEVELNLKASDKVNSISISLLYNENAHIFPPTGVEVTGYKNGKALNLVKEFPPVPTAAGDIRLDLLTYAIPEDHYERIKIKLNPIQSLPKWHPGSGSRGWVFVDEILLN